MENTRQFSKAFESDHWALILGGSSGMGLATAKKLASHGMNLFVVHRDRQGAMSQIEREFLAIRESGIAFRSFNLDALTPSGIETVLENIRIEMEASGKLRLLLHSIAYGSLKPLVSRNPNERVLHQEDLSATIHSMGTNLLTWVQKLCQGNFFASDARVIGLTSEGNQIAWRNYAAVSAAKCALESICRSIALEFAPFGIRCNVIQAGVTDTPALRFIPGHERLMEVAALRNPMKRTTLAEDIANVIYLMALDEASWINGAIIRVDGGEHIGS